MDTCVPAGAVRFLPLLTMLVCAFSVPVRGGQTVSSPWVSADIGAPALAGSASLSSGTFTIDAAGSDIEGKSDQFHFVYQAVTGDVDLRARIDDLALVHAWSKAGVMIRSDLTDDAANGFALATARKGLGFQHRPHAGAQTTQTAGEPAVPPRWVRLVRQGSRVTAYSSATGTTWAEIGSATIALGATAFVGIAVTSHRSFMRTTALVSNVTVTSLHLPAGQANQDIGGPLVNGSAAHANGTYSIRGAGEGIGDPADQFHYVYQQMTGDGTVVARVSSLSYEDAWTKGGVMFRETLSADSRHAFAFVSAGNGYGFQRRVEPASGSEHTDGGPGAAPGWLRLDRAGSTFHAYRSADGVTWTTMGSADINMENTVYVGIAVTSHNAGAAATAVVDDYRVGERAPVANKPPLVSLTAPANGATYVEAGTVDLAASASDPEGEMYAVEFYSSGSFLGRDTTAPYSLSWGPVPAGTYTLTAVALDAEGAISESAAVSITVTAAATTVTAAPRFVAFTASADHDSTLVSSYRLDLFAGGADPQSATPLATSDLGKPAPAADGEITVDRSTFFSALPVGSYVATVCAVGPDGESCSAPATFAR